MRYTSRHSTIRKARTQRVSFVFDPELILALSMKLSPIRGAWAGAQPQQVAGESVVALYHYTSVAET